MTTQKCLSFAQLRQMQEDRRPGFQALCDELTAKTPRLSRVQIEANAKLEWHRRNPDLNNPIWRKP